MAHSTEASAPDPIASPFRYRDRVVGRLGETGTVLGIYDDGSLFVKLDAPPQNRVRYLPIDLRLATVVEQPSQA